jgi:uncharacterized protein YndB with AHSA1/START domain
MHSSERAATVSLPSDREILITREFDAPKHLVYRAWTTPELVKQWWAGRRGTVDSVEIDLRVGGRWRYVMTANAGFEVAFHGEFLDIVPNERIVNTEVYEMPGADDANAPVNTVTFTESGGRTVLSMLLDAGSPEVRDLIMQSGMEVGMQESLAALEDVARGLG